QKKAKNDKKSPQSDSKSPSGRSAIRFF
ncbi:urease, partial [Vibrio cholerae]|nr:urease [Vibrio cholerae]